MVMHTELAKMDEVFRQRRAKHLKLYPTEGHFLRAVKTILHATYLSSGETAIVSKGYEQFCDATYVANAINQGRK